MENPEIRQESPDDIARKIAELSLAMNEDPNIIEDSEQYQKGWDAVDGLKAQLSEMVPENEASELVAKAKEEIKAEGDWKQAA